LNNFLLTNKEGGVSKFKQFAFLVAEGCEYETEYDGRMYTCCAYCGSGLSDDLQHDDDCAMLGAQRALGDEWVEYKAAEERRAEKENRHSVMGYDYTWNSQVECDICGKTVHGKGLRKHKKDNQRCRSLRKYKQ
jgi:hypothetical protein